MKRREPFDLKWTIRTYNVIMSLVNLYAFYRVSVLTKFGLNYFGCKQVGKSREDNELVYIAFLYFATKLVELLDTVFFILRKKYSQASNLHVFHHSFIAVCVWIYFKVAPGGSSVLFPYLNVGVHTIMYGYYFLATFQNLQKFLWWKRHLTSAQIVQFVLSMIHFSFQGLSSCDYPPALAIIGFTFNFVFFVLFCNFYYHTYLKKNKIDSASNSTITENTSKAINTQQVKSVTNLGPAQKLNDENNNKCISKVTSKVISSIETRQLVLPVSKAY